MDTQNIKADLLPVVLQHSSTAANKWLSGQGQETKRDIAELAKTKGIPEAIASLESQTSSLPTW
tara:strand:- start:52 stop:243 length:192 start_codon:yes stop_codon:yes gene_type:complete